MAQLLHGRSITRDPEFTGQSYILLRLRAPEKQGGKRALGRQRETTGVEDESGTGGKRRDR